MPEQKHTGRAVNIRIELSLAHSRYDLLRGLADTPDPKIAPIFHIPLGKWMIGL